MIRAVIALGSNSTRMLCADVEKGEIIKLLSLRTETKLFSGIENGAFTPDAMERGTAAVADFNNKARAMGATVDLIATSATRDAANSDRFIEGIYKATGLQCRVLSGDEEAYFGYMGAAGDREALVVDIGGGSTEIVCGKGRGVSLNIGASRLMMKNSIACPDDAWSLEREIEKEVSAGAGEIIKAPYPMLCIGGSATSCAGMKNKNKDIGEAAHGEKISRDYIAELINTLSGMTIPERETFPGLLPQRAPHIVHGLVILYACMTAACKDEMTVSTATNMDGYLYDNYIKTGGIKR